MRLWTLLGVFALMAHGVLSDGEGNTTMTEPSQPSGNETTSEPPVTNATTTKEPPTSPPVTNATTPEPTTPATPAPPQSEMWMVNGTHGPCIMMKMEAVFIGDSLNISLPASAQDGDKSTCNGTNADQVIELVFNKHSFTLTFVNSGCGAGKKFCTSSVIFENEGIVYSNSSDLPPLFAAKTGNSYYCEASNTFNLTSSEQHVVTVTVKNVQVQAFHDETKSPDFGTKEECAADDHTNDIVPIAVGCALAGLVIIVLIAYLVGRRRNRQKGYQSV